MECWMNEWMWIKIYKGLYLCKHSNESFEKYYHVVLFIIPNPTPGDVNQVCDHWEKIFWAVFSCGTACYSVEGISSPNFQVCGWNSSTNKGY